MHSFPSQTQKSGHTEQSEDSRSLSCSHRGSVLLVVLVVIVLLSLGVYSFTEIALMEREATSMFGRGARARAFADSGIEFVTAVLEGDEEEFPGNFYHRPELFQGMLLDESEAAYARGGFSVVAAVENDLTASTLRFGLIDESAKLNVNALVKVGLDEEQAQNALMELPFMTVDTADAILDFIDEDNENRTNGEEVLVDETDTSGLSVANRPLQSLDDLLFVRDVTPQLLYGEDSNRNGLLDPGEDVNGDGLLQAGWSALLTIYSKETNRRADGSDRVNVNQEKLDELFDQVELAFDEEAAKFVVAYRMTGAKGDDRETDASRQALQESIEASSNDANSQNGSAGQSDSSSQPSGGGRSNSRGGDGSSSQAKQGDSSGGQNGRSGGNGQPGSSGQRVERAGMDLSSGGSVTINSLFDLVDITVEVNIGGTDTELESPWASNANSMKTDLPELFDAMRTSDSDVLEGRININQARPEVLRGIPEMTDAMVDSIIGARVIGENGEAPADFPDSYATVGWLLSEKIVDLEQIRKLDKYITTRGDVYRVQVIGYFERGGPYARLEAIIDTIEDQPTVVFQRELSDLGRGFPKQQLMPFGYGF